MRNSPLLARLRVRLILLVLFAVLPALGVVIYTAIEQRREGLNNARVEAMRLVRMAAHNHDQSIESARQLLFPLPSSFFSLMSLSSLNFDLQWSFPWKARFAINLRLQR